MIASLAARGEQESVGNGLSCGVGALAAAAAAAAAAEKASTCLHGKDRDGYLCQKPSSQREEACCDDVVGNKGECRDWRQRSHSQEGGNSGAESAAQMTDAEQPSADTDAETGAEQGAGGNETDGDKKGGDTGKKETDAAEEDAKVLPEAWRELRGTVAPDAAVKSVPSRLWEGGVEQGKHWAKSLDGKDRGASQSQTLTALSTLPLHVVSLEVPSPSSTTR